MYEHTVSGIIRHHECDADGELKLHCLLDRMQDAAAEHAAVLNVGMEEMAEMQLIWVLSRLKIKLERPLRLGENLEVRTFPTGVQRIFAHRCYDLRVDGQRVGYAGSFWLPVNVAANRPVNAKKVLPPDIMDVPDAEKFFADMDKLTECTSGIVADYRVGSGDVDLNRHLNNAVYARWIIDVLGEKYASKSISVREVQLNYISAGQFGEKIFLRAECSGDGQFLISGEREDGSMIFQASGSAAV